MLAPLLLLWPMSVMLTWLVAQDIADQPYDRAMQKTIQQEVRRLQALPPDTPVAARLALHEAGEAGEPVRLMQLRGADGSFLGGQPELPLPGGMFAVPSAEVRLRDAVLDDRRQVRIASAWIDVPGAAGPLLLQLAEGDDQRAQLAADIIKGVILPQFVILPLALLLLWLALSRAMAPLSQLQRRIRQRDSSDLSPIPTRDVPEELLSLVRAINEQLERLGRSVELQRRFLADAAHQLKTPLAGLRTQAELAHRSIESGQADLQQVRHSLKQIERGSQSAAHTVNQLLTMARTENRPRAGADETVDLGALAADTVREFVPIAMERRIDLGFEGAHQRRPRGGTWQASGSLRIRGNPVLLRELICNLVDNALKYTPAGGTATVRVIADPFGQVAVLQVEDSGPGIAPAERDRVFQPFYRALGTQVEGSGLGLAIVSEIARQHGAEVLLEDANLRHRPGLSEQACGAFGPGCRFTLRFRVAAAR